jgi:hypothetical protein
VINRFQSLLSNSACNRYTVEETTAAAAEEVDALREELEKKTRLMASTSSSGVHASATLLSPVRKTLRGGTGTLSPLSSGRSGGSLGGGGSAKKGGLGGGGSGKNITPPGGGVRPSSSPSKLGLKSAGSLKSVSSGSRVGGGLSGGVAADATPPSPRLSTGGGGSGSSPRLSLNGGGGGGFGSPTGGAVQVESSLPIA